MKADAMHVVLVMESWGKGGTETYVRALAGVLSKNGIPCRLVLLSGNAVVAEKDCRQQVQTVSGYLGLLKYLRREPTRLLNLHLYSSLLPVVLMARLLGIRVVATLHMPPSAWGLRHRLYWRLAMRLSDKVIGVSRKVVDEIGSRNACTQPLPGGVPSEFFACSREASGNGSRFHVAAVGRLAVEKDWPTLIEAVAQLSEDLRNRIIIDFYGSGPLHYDLEALARRLSVDAVFHGHVGREALVAALARANFSVLPSRFEGLGLSALECMAAGVPTITADFAAAGEFIEQGVTGHMFPAGNAAALAQCIAWHAGNPDSAEVIGRAGREHVRQNFSEEVTYLPYLEIFRQAAS